MFTRLDVLQERVGHKFADLTLLYEALTHRSALMELSAAGQGRQAELPWNERLEFLGDSVLGLCVSQKLMQKGEGLAEGELSRIRASLVNEESLAEIARSLELGTFLILGKGAEQSGARGRDSLLADALEATIGAVFLDAGFEAADAVVGYLLAEAFAGDPRLLVHADFKTMLQELTQDKCRKTPVYEVVLERGPDHEKVFEVAVTLAGRELGRGTGPSKKRASQEAARRALDGLAEKGPAGQNPREPRSPSVSEVSDNARKGARTL